MRRWTLAPLAAATVAGMVVGAVTVLVTQPGGEEDPAPAAAVAPVAVTPSTIPVTKAHDGVLLVWTPTVLAAAVLPAATTAFGVRAVTVVRQDLVELVESRDADGAPVDRPPAGSVIPIDAIAVDPATYPALVTSADRDLFSGLGAGDVVLGETSAALRRLGMGATLSFAGGTSLRVVGVVADSVIGGAEAAVSVSAGATIGVVTERYTLVDYGAGRWPVEEAVRDAVDDDGIAVRFRTAAETPYLRAGDAVLPQVIMKQRFGEFSYRRGAGDEIEQDPAWVAANIVTADVPVLGRITCHRAVLPAIAAALDEMVAAQLGFLVDPEEFAGCWNARFTRAGASLSRHAWGVALDVNYSANPTNLASVQDPRLVELFDRFGFAWGGGWLLPDPAHFEFLRPPAQ